MGRVLVTGGNGFIGSALIEALQADGFEVHALAHRNRGRLERLLPADRIHSQGESPYSAAEVVTGLEPEVIFHLAAVYAEPDWITGIASMIDGNVALGASLLFGASHCQRRVSFVNAGTYWQFSQSGEYAPNTLYTATKQAFQDLLHYYEQKGLVSALTLVLYDTFGPADERNKLWTRLIRMRKGEQISLSEGTQTIQLVHLEDVVRGFLQAAYWLRRGQPKKTIYALNARRSSTLREMVLELNERANLELHLKWGEMPVWAGQVPQPWMGERLPGWEPHQNVLDAMVAEALDYRAKQETYDV